MRLPLPDTEAGQTRKSLGGRQQIFEQAPLVGQALGLVKGDALTDRKSARGGAPQRRERRAGAEGCADIVKEGAHIAALGTGDFQQGVAVLLVVFKQREVMDDNGAARALDLLSLAGEVIEALAADRNGRIHGRDLLDLAAEAVQRSLEL